MSTKAITFNGHKVVICYASKEAEPLLEFLFADIRQEKVGTEDARFTIAQDSKNNKWSLTRNKTILFQGDDINGLGNTLSGEVLFSLIENNQQGMAIHAGLVSTEKGSLLLPADSGSGKSSVTTWLLTRGWHYHTDELVMLDLASDQIRAFTRPLNIKASGLDTIGNIFDLEKHKDQVRSSNMVTMIPHRLVNPEYKSEIPEIRAVVFPKYSADTEPGIQRISGAEAGLEMMRSNVIARNLPGHGFGNVIRLVRNLPAYRLHYQHFDNLQQLIAVVMH
jgi:hypothetical protein